LIRCSYTHTLSFKFFINEVGLIPPSSKSQVVYSQRVKDQVAKQLLKNKELLAGVVADIPAEGYSKEAIHIMNFAPVVGLSWGGDDKRMLNYVGLIPPFPSLKWCIPRGSRIRLPSSC
jgi:hypothetical protein